MHAPKKIAFDFKTYLARAEEPTHKRAKKKNPKMRVQGRKFERVQATNWKDTRMNTGKRG